MSIRSKIVLTVTLFALVLLAAFLLDNRIITAMGRHRLVSLNNAMIFVTDTGIALITMVLLAFMLFTRRFQWFVLSSFAALTSLEITYVLKKIFQIPRPFLVENLAITPLTEPNGYSFPSLHATFCLAMVVFMDKIFKNKIWKWLAIIFYVVVIGSRLYLGVHYVSDLLAGGMIGYGVSKTLLFLDEKYSIWMWLCREWKKNVEVRRQVAHCCTGMALVLLIKFGLLQPYTQVLELLFITRIKEIFSFFASTILQVLLSVFGKV